RTSRSSKRCSGPPLTRRAARRSASATGPTQPSSPPQASQRSYSGPKATARTPRPNGSASAGPFSARVRYAQSPWPSAGDNYRPTWQVEPGISPRDGSVAILEGAGRAGLGQGREVHDRVRALGHRLGSAVVVEVGSGEARVGRVNQNAVKRPRVLD